MQKIAVFDIDGTVYTNTLSFELGKYIAEKEGFEDELSEVLFAQRQARARETTESYWIYNKTIIKVLETMLQKVSPSALEQHVTSFLALQSDSCYVYPLQLIDACKKEGRVLIAISGSIRNIVEPFAQKLGFVDIIASELEVKDSHFTGKRKTETHKGKDEILRQLVAEKQYTFDDSIGVGDTHRDASFMQLVARPIAFNPNAALYEIAEAHNWEIVLERKNMIYEMKKRGTYYVERAYPCRGAHTEHTR